MMDVVICKSDLRAGGCSSAESNSGKQFSSSGDTFDMTTCVDVSGTTIAKRYSRAGIKAP